MDKGNKAVCCSRQGCPGSGVGVEGRRDYVGGGCGAATLPAGVLQRGGWGGAEWGLQSVGLALYSADW